MDWNAYNARRRRHDRYIVAGLCTAVVLVLGVIVACTLRMAP